MFVDIVWGGVGVGWGGVLTYLAVALSRICYATTLYFALSSSRTCYVTCSDVSVASSRSCYVCGYCLGWGWGGVGWGGVLTYLALALSRNFYATCSYVAVALSRTCYATCSYVAVAFSCTCYATCSYVAVALSRTCYATCSYVAVALSRTCYATCSYVAVATPLAVTLLWQRGEFSSHPFWPQNPVRVHEPLEFCNFSWHSFLPWNMHAAVAKTEFS